MNLDRSRVISGILYEQTRHSCDIVEEAGTNGQRVHGESFAKAVFPQPQVRKNR